MHEYKGASVLLQIGLQYACNNIHIIIITIGLLMLLSVLFIITHLHILLESSIYNIQSFSTFSS